MKTFLEPYDSTTERSILLPDKDFACQKCGSELGWGCSKFQNHPGKDWKCGCEDTENEGLCKCDYWQCPRCGDIASINL